MATHTDILKILSILTNILFPKWTLKRLLQFRLNVVLPSTGTTISFEVLSLVLVL